MAKKKPEEQLETPAISVEPPEAPAKPAPSEPRPAPKAPDLSPVQLKRRENPKAVFKSFLPK